MKSNFYYSFLFLPSEEKEALLSFYSFCRKIDDQIDVVTDSNHLSDSLSDRSKIIQGWRSELKDTFRGSPNHPLTKKLKPFIERYHLSYEYFDEILNGMEMDVLQSSYATLDDLKLYCYRVASVVGLVYMEIFNDRTIQAKECAVHTGIAFQMTNILRDIFSDFKAGRIYLPKEDLGRFPDSENDLKNQTVTRNLARLVEFEINRTKTYYEIAERELQKCRNAGREGIEVMLKTYFQLLLRIEQNIWRLDRKVITLPFLQKVSIAGQVWIRGRLKKNQN